MFAVAVVIASFIAMEAVSYSSHRWLMHGPAMGWHRSHHLPPAGHLEKNDLFPLCFSVFGVAVFAAAAGWGLEQLGWVGIGVTAYGAAYLFVHDVVIHARLPVRLPSSSYLNWVRVSHTIHHRFGGEPYGMLLPYVPRALRERAAALDGNVVHRRTRATRIRL